MYRDYNTVFTKSKKPALHKKLQNIGKAHRKQHVSNYKWQVPQTQPVWVGLKMVPDNGNRDIKRAEHNRAEAAYN